jgi:hypothetical protein
MMYKRLAVSKFKMTSIMTLSKYFNLRLQNSSLVFSNTILFFFVIDTHYEKLLITPLGYFKFFRPPHCLQQTHENKTIATTYSRNPPCKIFLRKF